MYKTATDMQYNPCSWKIPNGGTNHGYFVFYPPSPRDAQMKQSQQQHRELKVEFFTMVEFNKHLKNETFGFINNF